MPMEEYAPSRVLRTVWEGDDIVGGVCGNFVYQKGKVHGFGKAGEEFEKCGLTYTPDSRVNKMVQKLGTSLLHIKYALIHQYPSFKHIYRARNIFSVNLQKLFVRVLSNLALDIY